MTELQTDRLTLHPVDTAEAERIIARRPGREDLWAESYPLGGDLFALAAFLEASGTHDDQGPFRYYRITRTVDRMTIGGIGFKGRPNNGSVEIGYGLVPSARGRRYAAEVAHALVALARQHGLSRIVAHTDEDNLASQRTLERVGFTRAGVNGDDEYVYVIDLVTT
ncbi:GNAT family N-acetyltransferase [Nocardioides panzhihuensis]|uniref:RimJ/RimL family protein N-acetyltransferase n=1 Tax=Nocardioides panzhihuensis TaxID=860243 RepID=A0A7Z0DK29_9ACTN|nr:RimJ/RimL family protein N-acetyltransferase [Nocardioides panzhihuensis]